MAREELALLVQMRVGETSEMEEQWIGIETGFGRAQRSAQASLGIGGSRSFHIWLHKSTPLAM